MSAQKNPAEYGYEGNEVIQITAREFASMRGAVDFFLSKETSQVYPEKYRHITPEGKDTKKVSPTSRKVVDIEKTLNSEPIIQRTKDGIELLKLRFMLENIHLTNIENGVAKHVSAFQPSPVDQPTESQPETLGEDVQPSGNPAGDNDFSPEDLTGTDPGDEQVTATEASE